MLKQKTDLRNIELCIGYMGTRYFGWQIQPDHPTVQGLIQGTLRRILQDKTLKTVGASRTDTGVHAHDNRVSFQTTNQIPTAGMVRSLNHLLPDDIRVFGAYEREHGFSVRYHAQAKHYSYLFYNGDDPSPFVAPYLWRYRPKLDVEAMTICAKMFEGTRCFKSLQASADHRIDTLTTIFETRVEQRGRVICFDVCGRHFLYHMVRNMAGSLLMVGKGAWDIATFRERFESGDRKLMGRTAPAQGLHLFKIYFQEPPYTFSKARDEYLSRIS